MLGRKTVLSVLMGALVLSATGCFNQQARNGMFEKAEAQASQPAVTGKTLAKQGWNTQTIAGISISSPLSFIRANSRMDEGLRDLEDDIRSKIMSYESWDADSEDGSWKVVVNRITYSEGTDLNLDEALSGTVEDIAIGLDDACKPQYTSASEMISGLPGRRLSLSCKLPEEGPVFVESVLFSDRDTLWQVQVAFQNSTQRGDATQILQSVKMNQVSRTF